jgi:putative transposase
MIDRKHALPISQQAKALRLSRGSIYYKPAPVSEHELGVMHRLDQLHVAHPFAGSRMLRDLLRLEGYCVGRKHVRTLMKRMGLEALYCQPRTTQAHRGHTVYPYLLRNLSITHSNQVWASDVSDIPMAHGFVYLTVILDWYSRRVLAWRVSVTMDVEFIMDALEEALETYGCPTIMNTDQGSQYTSARFIQALQDQGIQVSMDGKGAWRDNIFVERLWRSVKYEDIYLHAYETPNEVKQGLKRYFAFYNSRRPHRAHTGLTPDTAYFTRLPVAEVA